MRDTPTNINVLPCFQRACGNPYDSDDCQQYAHVNYDPENNACQ